MTDKITREQYLEAVHAFHDGSDKFQLIVDYKRELEAELKEEKLSRTIYRLNLADSDVQISNPDLQAIIETARREGFEAGWELQPIGYKNSEEDAIDKYYEQYKASLEGKDGKN